MNHVYRYEDGTYLVRRGKPTKDIQLATVGPKASLSAMAGAATTRARWAKQPKRAGKAVPIYVMEAADAPLP